MGSPCLEVKLHRPQGAGSLMQVQRNVPSHGVNGPRKSEPAYL